jgi:hypothetical protein
VKSKCSSVQSPIIGSPVPNDSGTTSSRLPTNNAWSRTRGKRSICSIISAL